jgi:hypothetical protein
MIFGKEVRKKKDKPQRARRATGDSSVACGVEISTGYIATNPDP